MVAMPTLQFIARFYLVWPIRRAAFWAGEPFCPPHLIKVFPTGFFRPEPFHEFQQIHALLLCHALIPIPFSFYFTTLCSAWIVIFFMTIQLEHVDKKAWRKRKRSKGVQIIDPANSGG